MCVAPSQANITRDVHSSPSQPVECKLLSCIHRGPSHCRVIVCGDGLGGASQTGVETNRTRCVEPMDHGRSV